MKRSIAIAVVADSSEQIPVRLFAAARTERSVPLTYYSAPQHINVRVVNNAHPITEGE